jgi:hypothetical protein
MQLIAPCAAYPAALMTLSKATAAFADAMGACAASVVLPYPLHHTSLTKNRLPGPSYEASTRLQAASGPHHLMSNH